MLQNLASKWTPEEVKILRDNLDNLELVELPGRSKAAIRAKARRLSKEIPKRLVPTMLKYHLEGESDGQILKRMIDSGYNYTLRDVAIALKEARAELEALRKKEVVNGKTVDK